MANRFYMEATTRFHEKLTQPHCKGLEPAYFCVGRLSVGRSVGKREPTEVNCMLRTRFRCRRRRTRPTAEPAAAAASPSFLPSPFGPLPPPRASLLGLAVRFVRARNYQIQAAAAAEANECGASTYAYVRRWYLTNATIPTRLSVESVGQRPRRRIHSSGAPVASGANHRSTLLGGIFPAGASSL